MAKEDSDSSFIPDEDEEIDDVLTDDEGNITTVLPTLRWRTGRHSTQSLTLRSPSTQIKYRITKDGPTLLFTDKVKGKYTHRLVHLPVRLEQEIWAVGFDNSQTANNSIRFPGNKPKDFEATVMPWPRGPCYIEDVSENREGLGSSREE